MLVKFVFLWILLRYDIIIHVRRAPLYPMSGCIYFLRFTTVNQKEKFKFWPSFTNILFPLHNFSECSMTFNNELMSEDPRLVVRLQNWRRHWLLMLRWQSHRTNYTKRTIRRELVRMSFIEMSNNTCISNTISLQANVPSSNTIPIQTCCEMSRLG